MKAEEDRKQASTIGEEGAKVTGGPASTEENTQQEKSGPSSSHADRKEVLPEEESKKEEISGHNELPEQTKVGGG